MPLNIQLPVMSFMKSYAYASGTVPGSRFLDIHPLRRLRAAVTAILALLVAVSTVHAEEPALTPYSAEYKVKISVLSGELTADLRPTEDGFEAVHVIKPTGLAKVIRNGVISESARFSTNDGKVKASWYRSEDSLSNDATRAEVSFDWGALQVSGL